MKVAAKVATVLVLGLILAYCQFWPRLIWHSIDRFTFVNGPNKSMIPSIFALGEDRETVLERLTQAGYNHTAVEPFDADDVIVSCGDSLCKRKREGYSRTSSGNQCHQCRR